MNNTVSTYSFRFPKNKYFAAATTGLTKNLYRRVTYHAREELARKSARKMWLDEDGKVTVYIVSSDKRNQHGWYIPLVTYISV